MTLRWRWHRLGAARRRAFTMVEVIISVLVMSVMLVAALNTIGGARKAEHHSAERSRGLLLAQALMAEILQQAYADSYYGPDSFGLGADEAATGDRSLFDDVDDYDGWQASPPQNKDGSPIPWADGYERLVSVAWVHPDNLGDLSGSPTGVKWIEVMVEHDGRLVTTLHAYRTVCWVEPVELQGGGS